MTKRERRSDWRFCLVAVAATCAVAVGWNTAQGQCRITGDYTVECDGVTYRAVDDEALYYVDLAAHETNNPGVPLPDLKKTIADNCGDPSRIDPVIVELTDYVDCTQTDHNFSDVNIIPNIYVPLPGSPFWTNPHPNEPSQLLTISGKTFRVTASSDVRPDDNFATYFYTYDLATGGTAGVPNLLVAESINDQERYTTLALHYYDPVFYYHPDVGTLPTPHWAYETWAPPYQNEPLHEPWGSGQNYSHTQEGPVFGPDVGLTTYTGREIPIDDEPFNINMIYYPKQATVRVIVSTTDATETASSTNGAAVSQMWSFAFVDPIADHLPVLTPPVEPAGERRIGIYMTHAWYFYAHFGTPPVQSAHHEASLQNLVENLKFCGMNYLAFNVINGSDRSNRAWYEGSEYFNQNLAGDLLEELPPICETEGIELVPVITSLQPTIENNLDEVISTAGYQRSSTGATVKAFNDPTLDPLHPEVQAVVFDLLGEIASRCASSSAVRGIGLRVNGKIGTCYSADQNGVYGAEKSGYSPYDLQSYINDTSSALPPSYVTSPSAAYNWLKNNEWEAWIDWRCEKTREFWLACRDVIQTYRGDLILYLQCDLPSEAPGTVLEWNNGSGTSPHELLRHHGYDPDLFVNDTGVVITRSAMVAADRYFEPHRWGYPFGPDPQYLGYRDFHFAPGLAELYRTAEGRAAEMYQVYWEEARHTYFEFGNPADPGGYLRTMVPAAKGRNFFEHAAMSMRRQDPDTITWLGWNRPNLGHENDIRKFAMAFRALPVVDPDPFDGTVDPDVTEIVARWYDDRLAVINDTDESETVTLTFASAVPVGGQVIDVVSGRRLVSQDQANRLSGSFEAEAFSLSTFEVRDPLLVPSEYATIQAAIDAAVDDDVVVVADGVYTGTGNRNLDFGGKQIVVRSANGAAKTIIDCQNQTNAFYFHNGETASSMVDGFTIRNGGGSGGAGILCMYSDPTIKNCVITDITSAYVGAAVYLGDSDSTFINCLIYGNHALYMGAGLLASGDSKATLINCTIVGNDVGYAGGGVYANGEAELTLENCILWDNEATSAGPQIALEGTSTATVSYSDVEGGQGDVYVGATASLTWGDGNINADPQFAGAGDDDYQLSSGSPCIDTGDNDAVEGVERDLAGHARIKDGDNDDTPTVDMGAYETGRILLVPSVYATIQAAIDAALDGDTVLVADGTYTGVGNRNLDFSNGLPAGVTRAIVVRSENGADSTTIDCGGVGAIPGFHFHSGEGLDSQVEGFTITAGGGIVCEQNSSPTITGCTIVDNTAPFMGRGGGIVCWDGSSPLITDCVISDNAAQYGGGGIYCVGGSPTIRNCSITGNSVSTGYGGGVACGGDSVLINCVISDNTASGDGGGVACYYTGSPQIINCTITGNADGFDLTGGIGGYQSNPTITNSIVWGNTGAILVSSGTVTVTYSDIEGGYAGTGNIDADPALDPDSAALRPGSPCIDAGDNSAVPSGITTDIAGSDRFLDDPGVADTGSGTAPIVDMGAYELTCESEVANGLLGVGLNGYVRSLVMHDDGSGAALYAGGVFSSTGDGQTALNGIARWDGSTWSSVGTYGPSANVASMVVFNDELYIGVRFWVSGAPYYVVAKWDGTYWYQVGSNFNDEVTALAVHDDGAGPALYAGGRFTTNGGSSAFGVAKLNAAGDTWLNIGVPFESGYVTSLASFDGDLYAGVRFTIWGGTTIIVAKWDGAAWEQVGGAFNDDPVALVVHNGALFVGGQFTTVGGVDTFAVAELDSDGDEWLNRGVPLDAGYVTSLGTYRDDLYAGITFSIWGSPVHVVSRWDGGTAWTQAGGAFNSDVLTIGPGDVGGVDSLYIGGYFTLVGGLPSPAKAIAAWGWQCAAE